MKKTYRELYFELKKENEYLLDIISSKNADILCEMRRSKDIAEEFYIYKKDLKEKQEKENKNFFIFSIIGISLLTIFAIISLFVG